MNKNNENQDFILFEGDLLTPAEALERLEAAQQVVSSLTARLGMATDLAESYQKTIGHKEGIIDRLIIDMRDNARALARCAGEPHKGKNEAILAVIYRLLSAEMGRGDDPYMDDVPF